MGVITISATVSDRQLVSGIPQFVTLATNIPAVIFYTLDGSVPDSTSSVYVSSIEMPRSSSVVRLRAFATNGTDTSGSLDVTYSTAIIENQRRPQAKVTFLEDLIYTNCAIGQGSGGVKVSYRQPHMGTIHTAGVTQTYFDGYDSNGNFPKATYDKEINFFTERHPESNWKGEPRKIGTVPKTQIVYVPPPPEETKLGSSNFDPRALVMFADSRDETDLVHLFRPYFYDIHPEKSKVSAFYETSQNDGHKLISGNFVNKHFNPKNNTWTYYYRDSLTNRWIISVEPAISQVRSETTANYLFNVSTSRQNGVGYVFRWVLFRPVGAI